MENLKLSDFDVTKIGASKQLNQIRGGYTYVNTGNGQNADGSTYKDWRKDSGSNTIGDSCGASDSADYTKLIYT